jgi:peptide/nickel transport system permease protein
MLQYGLRKLGHTALVALGVVTLAFAALRLSGDPAATMLPGDSSVEELAALRHALGLDRPLVVQYVAFLGDAVRGDFGTSFRHQQPALPLVLERLPATLELAFAALVLAIVIALPLGILAAIYRGRVVDMLAMAFAVVGQATPYFWMGIMLILIVSLELGWLPTSGRGGWQHLILPAVTLGTHFAAALARLTRTSMLEVLGQNFVVTARAKGLAERTVVLGHALKNAAVPIMTLIGLQFGTLLGGAVVTETIFAWPGVGRLAVQSIFVRDYPVVQAGVLVLALSFVAINLAVDVLYGWLDPRIRTLEERAETA